QAVGNDTFTVTATGTTGATASRSYTLTINKVGPPDHALFASLVGLTSTTALVGTGSVTVSGQLSSSLLVPTGTVLISVNGSRVSAVAEGDGSFTANRPTASRAAGLYTITYQYGGDDAFAGATGPGTLQLSYGVRSFGRPRKGQPSVKLGKPLTLSV